MAVINNSGAIGGAIEVTAMSGAGKVGLQQADVKTR